MKYYICNILIVGAVLTGCNSGGNSANPSLTNQNQTSTTQQPLISTNTFENKLRVYLTIANNSSQILNMSVPDSDNLLCQTNSGQNLQNCGNSPLTNTVINPNNELSFNMNPQTGNDGTELQAGTVSLSIYANNYPLFGIWQDGTDTPNPQNHYSSQYASNILEIQNWSIVRNNTSLFIGSGNTSGVVENSSYSTNSDGSTNLNITITDATPYTRTSSSVPGNSLCTSPTASCPNTLTTGVPNSITSDNGRYQLVMQTDGNLVIYNDSHKSIWASNTVGSGASFLTLGTDGNLGIYKPDGTPAWSINAPNQGATYLALGDDGNLGVYKPDGTSVWTSNSAQPGY